MTRSIALASLAGLLLLTTGCGSDKQSSPAPKPAVAAATTQAETVETAAGDTVERSELTVPAIAGVSDECMAMYNTFISALGGLGKGDTTDFSGLPAALRTLEGSLPSELHGTAETLANAYEVLATVLAKYGGDFAKAMSDPAAQADLAVLNSPEVQKANDDLSAYFDTACPGLNDIGS